MKNSISRALLLSCTLCISLTLLGCGSNKTEVKEDVEEAITEATKDVKEAVEEAVEDVKDEVEVMNQEPVTITLAAAASLKYSFDEKLLPMFLEMYPWITVMPTYDSSGKLQTQIESGMDADVFMSASMKQMNTLVESDLINKDSVVQLLENKLVLIVPEESTNNITCFEDITKAKTVAIGDPASVPAGQYAEEALKNLELWESIQDKVSLGTNVTEVLNWVAESSADAGLVYATDAATTDKVKVVSEAPKGCLEKPVIYPVGIVSGSTKQDAAKLLVDFLQTKEAMEVFTTYGFTSYINN